MCFLYARKFHPAMKNVAPVRRQLGIKTVFNILGPLTNPAKPKQQVSGVFHEKIGPMYIKALQACGVESALVVCGQERLDEISIAGPTNFWQLHFNEITKGVITPADFGVEKCSLDKCKSGTSEENAQLMKKI